MLSTNGLAAAELPIIVIPLVAKNGSAGVCEGTAAPPLSTQGLQRVIFEEANPRAPTVGSTFSKCSFGKTRLTARSSAVVEPVELPCIGSRCEGWSRGV